MEEMLKSWFPNIKLQDQPAVTHTEESVPTKKPKVRLHKCCVRALRLHKAGCQEHMLTTRWNRDPNIYYYLITGLGRAKGWLKAIF